jgi:hypothetical protein
MIVRDEEQTLPACLETVKGLVDEMVIADTGSTDGTLEVARRFGARCLSIPWENDFSRARNRALEEVRSDWVLALDADEQLDEKAKQSLPRLLKAPAIDGYIVTILDYLLDVNHKVWDFPAKTNQSGLEAARRFPAYVEHINVRLFRRRPQIYFVGPVHESVAPRILKLGGTLGKADFLIHHFGLITGMPTRIRKNYLYRQLGQKKVEETPNEAQAHLELGLSELALDNNEEALKYITTACQLNPRLGTAWSFQGMALVRLGRPAEALEALARQSPLWRQCHLDGNRRRRPLQPARFRGGPVLLQTRSELPRTGAFGGEQTRLGRSPPGPHPRRPQAPATRGRAGAADG